MPQDPLELTSGVEVRKAFWPTLRRAIGLMRDHRLVLIISIVLAIAGQVFTIAIPWATGRVVDEAMKPKDTDQLKYLIGLILVLAIGRFIIMYLRRIISGTMAVNIERDLRNLVYHHLLSLSFPFFDRNQTGQIMSRATVDLTTLRLYLGYGILFFTQHSVSIIAVMVVLFWMNPLIALMVLVIVPPLAILAILYSRRSQPIVTEAQQALAQVTTQAEESVVGVRVIKAFGQETQEVDRFRDRLECRSHATARAVRTDHGLLADDLTRVADRRRRLRGDHRSHEPRRLRHVQPPRRADRDAAAHAR